VYAWLQFQTIPFEICGAQTGTGTGFFLVLGLSPVSIITPKLHAYIHLSIYSSYLKGKRRSLGTSQKQRIVSEKEERLILR
jgi:hypothetical protein